MSKMKHLKNIIAAAGFAGLSGGCAETISSCRTEHGSGYVENTMEGVRITLFNTDGKEIFSGSGVHNAYQARKEVGEFCVSGSRETTDGLTKEYATIDRFAPFITYNCIGVGGEGEIKLGAKETFYSGRKNSLDKDLFGSLEVADAKEVRDRCMAAPTAP